MTVCNTGGLAAVERGTALGVVQTLHERGRLAEVLALETRPLLQGARLTTWELARMGAPHRLITDSAGPYLLSRGGVDAVLIGADRIAVNGDTANKIGSYALALGARRAGVPFIVVAPESTIDPATPSGEHIEIEDRASGEVVTFAGRVAPEGTQVRQSGVRRDATRLDHSHRDGEAGHPALSEIGRIRRPIPCFRVTLSCYQCRFSGASYGH